MKYNENSRAFASFSGACPYKCLHCYTFSEKFINRGKNNIDNILSDLKQKKFNIVYVSGYKENFINPAEGLSLIEEIYDSFQCDLLLTTRTVFDAENVKRLLKLNDRILKNGNRLYFCESVPAYDSYRLLESNPIIPTPIQRLNFLKQLHTKGITTILTIRPLCPDSFIPIAESFKIINEIKGYCSAIISSGIIVDDYILKKLNDFPKEFDYEEKNIMSCLNNDIQVKYVNVTNELKQIENMCINYNIPFFKNSLPAINYIDCNL